MTASLTGFSLRGSGGKPLARAAYFKTNPNAEPLDSVNKKEIDSGTFGFAPVPLVLHNEETTTTIDQKERI